MRTACVWFPDWPLGRPDAPSGRAWFVVGERSKVVATAAPGVDRGMERRVAEGQCPDAVVLERDVGEEWRRFEPVLALMEDVVAGVEVVEPGLVFVPFAGPSRYHGGEREAADLLAGKLAADGYLAQVAVADGPFAARWAAEGAEPGGPLLVDDTPAFLAGLDVGRIDQEELVSTFRWLGVTTLGALAALPREAIASRFGSVGLQAHRMASGDDRTVVPRHIPPESAVEERFEDPLESLDQVAFASRSLAVRLMNGLREIGVSPHRLVVTVEAGDGVVRERVWRSGSPFSEDMVADRVWWQIRSWVESSGMDGVALIRLDPSDLSGEGRQLDLLVDEAALIDTERAVARVQALVGPEAVVQAEPDGGRLPASQVAWSRWGEPQTPSGSSTPWPGATPTPTPALVPPDPVPLTVEWDEGIPVRVRLGTRWEPVLTWSGPWRLHGRWWKGEGTADRYQLVTSAGAFLCVVSDGGTTLAGVYD